MRDAAPLGQKRACETGRTRCLDRTSLDRPVLESGDARLPGPRARDPRGHTTRGLPLDRV